MECSYCNKECKNNNAKAQHERFCKLNPNHIVMNWHATGVKVSHQAWNKGLTKETDERVKQYGETYTKNNSGENSVWFGRKHSEESKAKISATQKENYCGVSRYVTVREQRQSFAEDYFDEIFTSAVKQYHVGRFFLDYAWPKSKIYIEVDGEQHYTEEGLKHDKERTEVLLNEGWKLLKRIRWSEYQKLSKLEKENEVYRLLQTIKIQENF